MKRLMMILLTLNILTANDINATISSNDVNMTELQIEEALENEFVKG